MTDSNLPERIWQSVMETHSALASQRAILERVEERQDRQADLIRDSYAKLEEKLDGINGRLRRNETAIAWIKGVGTAVSVLFASGLGWLGWKR